MVAGSEFGDTLNYVVTLAMWYTADMEKREALLLLSTPPAQSTSHFLWGKDVSLIWKFVLTLPNTFLFSENCHTALPAPREPK